MDTSLIQAMAGLNVSGAGAPRKPPPKQRNPPALTDEDPVEKPKNKGGRPRLSPEEKAKRDEEIKAKKRTGKAPGRPQKEKPKPRPAWVPETFAEMTWGGTTYYVQPNTYYVYETDVYSVGSQRPMGRWVGMLGRADFDPRNATEQAEYDRVVEVVDNAEDEDYAWADLIQLSPPPKDFIAFDYKGRDYLLDPDSKFIYFNGGLGSQSDFGGITNRDAVGVLGLNDFKDAYDAVRRGTNDWTFRLDPRDPKVQEERRNEDELRARRKAEREAYEAERKRKEEEDQRKFQEQRKKDEELRERIGWDAFQSRSAHLRGIQQYGSKEAWLVELKKRKEYDLVGRWAPMATYSGERVDIRGNLLETPDVALWMARTFGEPEPEPAPTKRKTNVAPESWFKMTPTHTKHLKAIGKELGFVTDKKDIKDFTLFVNQMGQEAWERKLLDEHIRDFFSGENK
jgi:hypothetical protein